MARPAAELALLVRNARVVTCAAQDARRPAAALGALGVIERGAVGVATDGIDRARRADADARGVRRARRSTRAGAC